MLLIESQGDIHGEKDYLNGAFYDSRSTMSVVIPSLLRNRDCRHVLPTRLGYRNHRSSLSRCGE